MRKVLKGLLKRKMLFATVSSITVFAGVYGFAATLNVTSNKLSAGNVAVQSCQATAPNSTYAVAYDSTLGGYKVSSVTVTGLATACGSLPINVTLTGASNASLNEITGTIPAGGGSLVLTPGSTVDASLVSGVSVAING